MNLSNVCSWKTIAVVALFLLGMIEISQGFAGPITPTQVAFQNVMYKNISEKDTVINVYWKTEVKKQVQTLMDKLPIRTGEDTWLVGVKLDIPKRLIIYRYNVRTVQDAPQMNTAGMDTKFSDRMCKDPEGRFFLITMEGTMVWEHYTPVDKEKPFMVVTVSSDNCQDI